MATLIPKYIQGATGTVNRPINLKLAETVSVKDFGAVGDGVTDNGIAFRSALAYLDSIGGGALYVPTGSYAFTTWDTVSYNSTNNLALFTIPSNVEFYGDGIATEIIITSTAHSGIYNGGANRTTFIACRTNETGQYLHDFKLVAGSGVINLSITDAVYGIYSMSGGIRLERITANQCPFRNGFVCSGGNSSLPMIIDSCTLIDNGPNMTGNTISADYSAIYVEGPGSVVSNCNIYNTINAISNAGGIEAHSSRYTIQNNYINNMYPGIFIGVQDLVTTSMGSLITNNTIKNCYAGIAFVDKHDGLIISNNYFYGNSDVLSASFTDIYCPLNSTDGISASGIQKNIRIEDNIFDCTTFRSGASRAGLISRSINVTAFQQSSISNNTFVAPTTAVSLAGSVTAAISNVIVANNMLVNVNDVAAGTLGYFSIFGDSSAGWATGTTFTNITFSKNRITKTSTLANIALLLATNGGTYTATYTNIQAFDNSTILVRNKVVGGGRFLVYRSSTVSEDYITAAATITPYSAICFVTGATPIDTITAPPSMSTGSGTLTIIPLSAFTTTTAGNIAIASTAVTKKAMIMTYESAENKWYPSY